MRVLFDHSVSFALAHGGFQIQIEKTRQALQAQGVEVEYLRWWDDRQTADLIHYFGGVTNNYLQLSRRQSMPVVLTTLFTETCNRTDGQLARQRFFTQLFLRLPFGAGVKQQLSWQTYLNCSMNVVGLEAERAVLETVYHVPSDKISIVPLGLSDTYLQAGHGPRTQDHLICTGTITERKNSVKLAELALLARVPILFVGKPYTTQDPYWKRFEKLIDQKWIQYHPHVNNEGEMIHLLQTARGFVLKSEYENWCLSAHEAAACGLPTLLPDQKWSRERFGEHAHYFAQSDARADATILRQFYDRCPNLPASGVQLFSWHDAARQIMKVYEKVLLA